MTQGAPLLYAQSLRGDPKKESDKSKEGEKVVVLSNAIAVPWWLFPAAGGVIAVSLSAAFWLGRRYIAILNELWKYKAYNKGLKPLVSPQMIWDCYSTKMVILREPLSVAQEERIDK